MAVETERTTKPRRRIRVWHVPLAVVIVLIAVALGLRWHWMRGFRGRIEAIAAAGYPVTPEELDAWYEAPQSGENAADWVLDAATFITELPRKERESLERIVSNGSDRLSRRVPIPEETKRLLVAHVRENAKALELLHRAATMKESRYPVYFSGRLRTTFLRHVGGVRDGCLLLCYEAIACSEAGDGEGATRAMEAAFRIARTLQPEPLLASQMVRFWVQSRAAAATGRVLGATELTSAQLERLGGVVDEAYDPDGMVRAFAGLQCACLELFERPQSADPEAFGELPSPAFLEAYSALGLAAREGIIFLEVTGDYIEAAQLPTPERRGAFEAIGVRFRARRKGCVLLAKLWGGQHLTPVDVQCLADLRTTSVALAAERCRLGRGGWPDSLADLVPDYSESVPVDPFDGEALRYKRLDGGFVVYSVGEDGVDDGGKERPTGEEEKPDETYDITFAVQR
jgi:hypothetical protein